MESTDDLGLALRAKREATGRSLRDVADVTKLGVRTLDALERNQVDRLPPGIFRRSVVRAYAKEIGLDPEATLLAFLERHPDNLPPPGRPTGPVADAPLRMTRSSDISPWLVVGLVVAVIILLAVVVLQWSQRGATAAPAGGERRGALARGHAPDAGRSR
ncbi:MAG: helix-turn-helix domain-containing protein [Acidobacteria bacterium]|nr:helix-turn-helix domain-containing protein [Acidobacteriota bacterium]